MQMGVRMMMQMGERIRREGVMGGVYTLAIAIGGEEALLGERSKGGPTDISHGSLFAS